MTHMTMQLMEKTPLGRQSYEDVEGSPEDDTGTVTAF